nr:hypothetical protein [uncultured Methanoregula sp.]
MPHEADKILDDSVTKTDPPEVPLRTDNKKTYPCKKCGEVFDSRQALFYHQKRAKIPCCPDDAVDPDPDPNEIPPHQPPNPPAKLTGDTPPIPIFLVILLMAVLVVLGLVLVSWEKLYNFSKKVFNPPTEDSTDGTRE